MSIPTLLLKKTAKSLIKQLGAYKDQLKALVAEHVIEESFEAIAESGYCFFILGQSL